MAATDWTEAQNDAIVADYFAMLTDDIAGHLSLAPRLSSPDEAQRRSGDPSPQTTRNRHPAAPFAVMRGA